MKLKTLTILAKRTLCLLALAATAGLLLPACDKEPDQQTTTPVYRAPYEKELGFDISNVDSIAIPIVKHFANDTACKKVYLVVRNPDSFTIYKTTDDIHTVYDFMKKRIEISDKISGSGTFRFLSGVISPEDSIWFEQHGWMVNHY